MAELSFPSISLQSLVSHDPSEIILMTFLLNHNMFSGIFWFKVHMKSKLTRFILLAPINFCCEEFIHASQSTKKCAFIIFNPNLKMLLPSKLKGLLSWHQFDGLGMSVTSWTTPLQLPVFWMKRLLYYIQSIHALYFPHSIFCSSRKYITIRK